MHSHQENLLEKNYQALINLGIPSELLNKSLDYVKLYELLKGPCSSQLRSPLKITQAWQLEALGNHDFWSTLQHDAVVFGEKDNLGAGIGLYAAWSGYPAALDLLKKHTPESLKETDKYGRNIAHYAARSGNPAALDWIKKNVPELLKEKSINGLSPANYAALSGKPPALYWMEKNVPEFKETNSYIYNIANSALESGNPKQFNAVFSLLKDLTTFTLKHYSSKFSKELIETFLSALETNYYLTEVVFECGGFDEKQKIVSLLQKNEEIRQEIKQAIKKFVAFLPGSFQENPEIGLIPEIYPLILQALLPNKVKVDEGQAHQAVEKYASIKNQALSLINQEITRLTPYTENSLFTINSQPKIRALETLCLLIQSDHKDKINDISDWEKTHRETLYQQDRRIDFFKSIQTSDCVYRVMTLLKVPNLETGVKSVDLSV